MARVSVGKRLYGRCDQIPNVGHVAHYFFHMGYSPLIPLGSVFVVAANDSEVKLPFSFKAMFFGYLRACLVWCVGIAGFTAFFALNNVTVNLASGPTELTKTNGYEAIGLTIALLVLLALTYVVARPSQARKAWILNHLQQAGVQADGSVAGQQRYVGAER